MARANKAREVDGFSALRAAQRATGNRSGKTASPAPVGAGGGARPRIAAHIGHTVMPTRYELVCYVCSFSFSQTGRSATTACPKCRAVLDLSDHEVSGAVTEDLRTAGRVHLKPQATLDRGRIEAGEVILEGRMTGGAISAARRLEVRGGAEFPEEHVQAPHWIIGADVAVRRRTPLICRVLELHGTFEGAVEAAERVVIHRGACLAGSLTTPGLEVAEGGGLRARVAVRAEASA